MSFRVSLKQILSKKHFKIWGGILFAVGGLTATGTGDDAWAQSTSDLLKLAGGMSSGQLMQLQQQMSQQMDGTAAQTTTGQSGQMQQTIIPQAYGSQIPPQLQPLSALEQIYTDRLKAELPPPNAKTPGAQHAADQQLRQFGYDQMGVGGPAVLASTGGILNDYVLGAGDEILVSLRGQENAEYRVSVDRSGRVTLPRMNPVVAAGLTFQDFKQNLEAAIRRAYASTSASISIGSVRQITVLVSGEVNTPGTRTLTGLATAVDALMVSGGVRRSGSLRNIHIVRNNRVIPVDLYAVLTGHTGKNAMLADGDRVVVPPIGATIAVTGDMKRQGIFELPSANGAISLHQAMDLAGGPLMPGIYRISLLRQMQNGSRELVDITGQKNAQVKKGEILVIKLAADISLNQVSLQGAARSPGMFSLGRYKTLHDMLPSADVLNPDAYMLFGYIDRVDRISHLHTVIPFSPLHVVAGTSNETLQMDDKVVIFSRTDMQSQVERVMKKLKIQESVKIFSGQNADQPFQAGASAGMYPGTNAAGTGAVYGANTGAAGTARASVTGTGIPTTEAGNAGTATAVAGGTPALPLPGAYSAPTDNRLITQAQNAEIQSQTTPSVTNQSQFQIDQSKLAGNIWSPDAAQQLEDRDQDRLDQMLIYYRANIDGAVQDPGIYLIAPGTSLAEAIIAAGGLKPDADLTDVEVTSTVIDSGTGAATTQRKNYSLATASIATRIILSPKDDIIFRSVYTDRAVGSVTVEGQVRYPGTYSLLRGERLSSVLARAGGLTETAYPYGTVFLRQSIARLETKAHEREAKQLEEMLITSMSRVSTDSQMRADSFTALQDYITTLKNQPTLGRMTVVADPKALQSDPEDDPIMEAGDQVYIPQHPYTVSVMGEVLQPTSIPYRKDRSANEYVKMAGGLSQQADDEEIFVVLPDGVAYRANQSWFDFGDKDIPPGSLVYVGRDISGYDFRQGVIDVTKIFAQMATSLAAIAAISND